MTEEVTDPVTAWNTALDELDRVALKINAFSGSVEQTSASNAWNVGLFEESRAKMDSLEAESRAVKEALRVASKSFKELGLPPPSAKDKATVEKAYKSIKEDLARAMQLWQEALNKARASEARTAVTAKHEAMRAHIEKLITELTNSDKDQPANTLKQRIEADDVRIAAELAALQKGVQAAVAAAKEWGLDVTEEASRAFADIEQRVMRVQATRRASLKARSGSVSAAAAAVPPLDLDGPPRPTKSRSESNATAAAAVAAAAAAPSGTGSVSPKPSSPKPTAAAVAPRTSVTAAPSATTTTAAARTSLSMSSSAATSAAPAAAAARTSISSAAVPPVAAAAATRTSVSSAASAGATTAATSKRSPRTADAEVAVSAPAATPAPIAVAVAPIPVAAAVASVAATKPSAVAPPSPREPEEPGVAIPVFTDAVIAEIVNNRFQLPLKGLPMPICARMVKDLAVTVAHTIKERSDAANEGLMAMCHEKFQRLCTSDVQNVELAQCACTNALALIALRAKMDTFVFKGQAIFPLIDAAITMLQIVERVAPESVIEKAKQIDAWRKKTIKLDAGTSARMAKVLVTQAEDLKRMRVLLEQQEERAGKLEK